MIKNWIICILIGSFIVNIVDIILPKTKLKPYIKLVCNLIFVFIVISPIIDVFSNASLLEDKVLKSITDYSKKYIDTNSDFTKNSQALNKEYENSLKAVLDLKLEEYGYELEDIDFNENEIESIRIKEKSDKENNLSDNLDENKESEVFKNNTVKKNLKTNELKDDLIKILDISIDKIEID